MRKKDNPSKNRQIFKTIKVVAIVFLMCATVIGAQRTDHEETYSSYSDMSEYTIRFYDIIGNDSIYVFDSDQYGTHVMLLNGTDRSVTFYGNVTMMRNLTMSEFNVAGFVKNDATGLLSGGNSIDISADTNLGGTAPIVIVGDDVTITQAGVASDGYLSSVDWNNFNTAFGWGNHALVGYLTDWNDGDPFFNASIAAALQQAWLDNWNTSYSWGDHSGEGYITNYGDPWFNASVAATIVSAWMANWNVSYGWGDHSLAGYLTNYGDQWFNASDAHGFTWAMANGWNASGGVSNWTRAGTTVYTKIDGDDLQVNGTITDASGDSTEWNAAYGWGDHSGVGYLTNYGDPWFNASVAATIVSAWMANWNVSYGWGDHALVGYLTNYGDPWFNASDAHGFTWAMANGWNTSGYWNRSGTTVYPFYDGDDVQINSTLYTKGNITMEGNRTISATENLTVGNDGNIVLCLNTLRDMYPYTDLMVNLGTDTNRFNNQFIGGFFNLSGNLNANGSDAYFNNIYGNGSGLIGVVSTSYWNHSDTTVYPATDGDDVQLNSSLSFNNDFNISRQPYNGNYLEVSIDDSSSRYVALTNAGTGYLGLRTELFKLLHPVATLYLDSDEVGGSGMSGIRYDTVNEAWITSNENAYGNNFLIRDVDASLDCLQIENDVGTVLIKYGANITGACIADAFHGDIGNCTNATNRFNQELNTYNNVTFENITGYNITANGYLKGNGALITGLPSGFVYSDWFNQKLNDTDKPTFPQINITNSSIRFYEDSGHLYINNSNINKDMIFSINDGGVQKDFLEIDSSKPMFKINAGTGEGGIAAPFFFIDGNMDSAGTAMSMRFDVVQAGAGTVFITYGQPSTTGITGGGVIGHYLKASGVNGASGTYIRQGFKADMDSGITAGAAFGGTYTERGFNAEMANVFLGPTNDGGANMFRTGVEISRNANTILNNWGGSINDFTTYGIHIKGWGSADTITGVGGTYTTKAICSDGGNVSFDNGHMVINGSMINSDYALDVEGDIECVSVDQTSDERVKTLVMSLEDIPNSKIKELCDNINSYVFRWNNFSYLYNITRICWEEQIYNDTSNETENVTKCMEHKKIIGIDYGEATDNYDIGIPAQHLYSYLMNFTDNPSINYHLANGLVNNPSNEDVELWNVNYKSISLIFDRYTQILAEELVENNVFTGKLVNWAMSLPEPYRFDPNEW